MSLYDDIANFVKNFKAKEPETPPEVGYGDPPTAEYIDRIKKDSEIAEWIFRHIPPPDRTP